MTSRIMLLVTGALLVCAMSLPAQEVLLVHSWDPVYEDVDRLANAGLVPDLPLAQRPWSVRQLREVADTAGARLEASVGGRPAGAHLQGVLERVRRRAGMSAPLSGELLVEGWVGDSPTRTTPYSGVGRLADATHPILAYRRGRPGSGSGGLALEPAVGIALHPRLGVYVRPRFHLATEGPAEGGEVGVQALYARGVVKNLAVVVGRSDVLWSRRPDAGLLMSGNARPLDMIHLSNDLPLRAGVLGSTRLSFFAADLGKAQRYPHTKLFGAKFSARPVPELELALSFLNEQGGEGAPEASFWDRVADIFIVPDLIIDTGDFEFSEKFAGGELRWWATRDLHFFLEGVLTDFDLNRFGSTFTDDASWSGGGELSGLGSRGAGWFRLSATTTGQRFYRHEQFSTGLAVDGAILGSALGPDATGATVEGGWEDRAGRRWAVAADWEVRSADVWSFHPEETPTFRRTEDRPEETRLRLRGRASIPLGRTLLEVAGAAETIGSFAFEEGDDRTAGVILVRVSRVLDL